MRTIDYTLSTYLRALLATHKAILCTSHITPTNDDVYPSRHVVNLQHEHAVHGAVSSDSEDMQVILQDFAGSDAAIDDVTAAHHDAPLVKTQYDAVPTSITICT
jgi:hypothetical protein